MTLKGLHDSSFIWCKSLTIYIADDFFDANFIEYTDEGVKGGVLDTLEEIEEMGPRPSLYIRAENKNIEVMNSFDILKMQIMAKIKDKK